MDSTPAIVIEGLTKRFGRTLALDRLSLTVPRGVVFGYLGPNGSGKTTTARVLMGHLRATAGRATVLGADAFRDRDRVHGRVGYLPGEFSAYPDLSAGQYLEYLANLRGAGSGTVDLLAKRLSLDLDKRIGSLSHGNRQKVGLIQAFMHDPDVLILDEPTLGLDPLMQQEFLSLVREARDAGRTVFLSSHILDEVEEVADLVGILRAGRLLVVERVEALKARAMRRMTLTFAGEPPLEAIRLVAGVQDIRAAGASVRLTIGGSTAELLRAVAPHGVENIVTHEAGLEEIFLDYYHEEA